jgi:hypothetical protein
LAGLAGLGVLARNRTGRFPVTTRQKTPPPRFQPLAQNAIRIPKPAPVVWKRKGPGLTRPPIRIWNNPNEPRTPSEAKINANRENAKKSTGPRTAEGKNASSRNRLLHGLRANKHILLDEDPEEFLFLLDDHLDRFQPVGASEENLVLRIAADQCRLDRVFSMEAGIYRDRFHDVAAKEERRQDRYATKKDYAEQDGKPAPPPPIPPDERDLPARAFNVDCEGPNSFTKLARYETSIERSIDRCLRQLKTYQAARAACRNPSPRSGAGSPACRSRNALKINELLFEPKKWGYRQI